MNNVLAPYLWIFALVYIDDIVIFSITFEDHLKHLDQVFAAIAESGITLSPKKCNLGYQSLLLLGQKVSRLGLSTHKEKVDAILKLEAPKNIPTLQTFLGMMTYFASYIPYYNWIVALLYKLLRKDTPWKWTKLEQEAFELSKQALSYAPVMAYPVLGKPYRLYTDACDYGISAILQQVQPIQIKDLKGTKVYKTLEKAYKEGKPVPKLITTAYKQRDDMPGGDTWDKIFEDTTVHIERVIAYWSRILKSAETRYSATEREALALKEGLVKFQVYLEGAEFLAITDHAALTWSKTYHNVNRRLMAWGTVFSAFPGMKIVHQPGKANVPADAVSRLRQEVPPMISPLPDGSAPLRLNSDSEGLTNLYKELGDKFKNQVMEVASAHVLANQIGVPEEYVSVNLENSSNYLTTKSLNLLVHTSELEVKKFTNAYNQDPHFSKVYKALRENYHPMNPPFSQYQVGDNGLLYFIDWAEKLRLCIPKNLQLDIIKENHDDVSNSAHAGYAKPYNRIASVYY
jgi:hypothetical protein